MASRLPTSSTSTHKADCTHGATHTTHSSTITEMLTDTKTYMKSLILRLKTKRTKEECEAELNRMTEEMKKDVSDNIDAIIQQVIDMRPQPGSRHYEETNRLYDSILDQMIQMMDDLQKTFTSIFTEFNNTMEQMWLAIRNNRDDELHAAKENFHTILEKYRKQWSDAFQGAHETVSKLEKDLSDGSKQNH